MKWLKWVASIFVITVNFAHAHEDNTLWIDVRSAEEFSAGHLEAATNIPHDQIAGAIADTAQSTDQPIVVYCRSGRRAELAKEALNSLGYKNVVNATDMDGAQALFDERNHADHE